MKNVFDGFLRRFVRTGQIINEREYMSIKTFQVKCKQKKNEKNRTSKSYETVN